MQHYFLYNDNYCESYVNFEPYRVLHAGLEVAELKSVEDCLQLARLMIDEMRLAQCLSTHHNYCYGD